MDKFFSATHFLKYKLMGGTAHDVHSPFVFDLLNDVIRDETPFYIYDKIEALRARLLLDESILSVTDLGTGGERNQKRSLKVKYIAGTFLKSARCSQLLFRLVNHFHPKNILELGTSLGITTLYLASPYRKTQVITMEGCPETANKAREHFDLFQMENIRVVTGDFGLNLSSVLENIGETGMVFFDGNHKRDATLSYFNQALRHAGNDTIFIFDDIHWSREMEAAWNTIKANPRVTLSIDLFQLGLIFFRSGIPRQHFVLKF
ncbi:MAG: class I SAM-dependent methyltransferase [Bacteroidetes bacterium]|nr:class I SAM-dependent methyltransferase [Bacteroidota bacterium]